MKKLYLFKVVALVSLSFCAFMLVSGCTTTGSDEVELNPTVDESALITPGTLTVGVDSTFAPFGGESGGELVGVDVDVAAAISAQLGLELQVIDVASEDVDDLLKDEKVDVIMNITNVSGGYKDASTGDPYADNSVAIFGKSNSEYSAPSSLSGASVGAYTGSVAASLATEYCDAENLKEYGSLSDAFDALENDEIDYISTDIVGGGYLSTSYSDIVYLDSLSDDTGVYYGVSEKNKTLLSSLNDALTTIEDNGILEIIMTKWVGESCVDYVLPRAGSASESA